MVNPPKIFFFGFSSEAFFLSPFYQSFKLVYISDVKVWYTSYIEIILVQASWKCVQAFRLLWCMGIYIYESVNFSFGHLWFTEVFSSQVWTPLITLTCTVKIHRNPLKTKCLVTIKFTSSWKTSVKNKDTRRETIVGTI